MKARKQLTLRRLDRQRIAIHGLVSETVILALADTAMEKYGLSDVSELSYDPVKRHILSPKGVIVGYRTLHRRVRDIKSHRKNPALQIALSLWGYDGLSDWCERDTVLHLKRIGGEAKWEVLFGDGLAGTLWLADWQVAELRRRSPIFDLAAFDSPEAKTPYPFFFGEDVMADDPKAIYYYGTMNDDMYDSVALFGGQMRFCMEGVGIWSEGVWPPSWNPWYRDDLPGFVPPERPRFKSADENDRYYFNVWEDKELMAKVRAGMPTELQPISQELYRNYLQRRGIEE